MEEELNPRGEDVSVLEILALALRFGIALGSAIAWAAPAEEKRKDAKGAAAVDVDSLF